jgi:cytochrome b subunit of formate dehydrogenase
MYVSILVVLGHLYLALIYPSTRHALRGMATGNVRRDWAWEHHRKWLEGQQPPSA